MKKIFLLALCYLSFVILSCNSTSELPPINDCKNHFLTEFEMSEYTGGEIPCGTTYLVLFENESSSFAILHNDCADLLPQLLIDCDGNELCTYVTEEGCFEMVQNSERIGVIGIEEN